MDVSFESKQPIRLSPQHRSGGVVLVVVLLLVLVEVVLVVGGRASARVLTKSSIRASIVAASFVVAQLPVASARCQMSKYCFSAARMQTLLGGIPLRVERA